MTTLTQQLELLKEQQEGLEKRIQEEKEHKKKLNNEASIERLEALVEPITRQLDYDKHKSLSKRKELIIQYESYMRQYNNSITNHPNGRHGFPPKKVDELEKEEIYVTLIGILKKQDERIKELEKNMG
tara:strand:- start:207 stop:590 length:384 start_codon:yes stop_codon:yes gene_type:complete